MFISIDLDDTLLKSDKSLSDFSKKVLENVRKLGHFIIINTARSLESANSVIKEFDFDYCVLNGGSLVIDNNYNILYESKINKFITNKIVNSISSICSVQTSTYLYTTEVDSKNPLTTYRKKEDGFYFESYKILLHNVCEEVIENICIKYNLSSTRYFSGPWVRLTNKNISKLTGLNYILNLHKSTLSECISFGDDHSDYEMLKESKYGVCMANSVKKLIEEIPLKTLSNDEDGVCVYLKNYFRMEEIV